MKIEHIAIWTGHLEPLREFYCTYFGGQSNTKYLNPAKEFSSYFITFQSGARLELMHKPQLQPSQQPANTLAGYVHLAFSVGSRQQVNALTDRLRTDGFRVVGEPRTTGDGYYESVVADPDGNLIEITI
jgi:lactoylglutathione lyase